MMVKNEKTSLDLDFGFESRVALITSFYARKTLLVARELLGKILAHRVSGTWLAGRIVECEAYLGEEDPASHAYRGPTPRCQVMFEGPGRAYVYFIYGNHFCFNVVAHDGKVGAILIRALEPLYGIEVMKQLRSVKEEHQLTNGPGKLAQALGITRAEQGSDLSRGELLILEAPTPREKIITSPRIGLSRAQSLPYRFSLRGNPYVSKPQPR